MRADVIFLELEDVELAHRRAIERWGGQDGFIDRRLLDSAIMAPRNGYYSSLVEFAAAYTFGICRAHAYQDGNKRAAILGAGMFLGANGYHVDLDPEEWEDVMLRVASKSPDSIPTIDELASLFAELIGTRGEFT